MNTKLDYVFAIAATVFVFAAFVVASLAFDLPMKGFMKAACVVSCLGVYNFVLKERSK